MQEILARRPAPGVTLSQEEIEVFEQEQHRRTEDQLRKDFDRLAEQLFRPRLDLSAIPQNGVPLDQAVAELGAARQQHPVDPWPATPEPGAREQAARTLFACRTVLEIPPYTTGVPTSEQVGPAPTGALNVFRSSSRLALPELGAISLGVGNGNLLGLGTYPSSTGWLFGDANSAQASLLEILPVPGSPPIVTLGTLYVTADIRVGGSLSSTPVLLLPGSRSSTGNGLVGVMGTAYLYLYAAGVPGPRVASRVFLLSWRAATGDFEHRFTRNFSVSTSVFLGPGSTWIAAGVSVTLLAFRAGVNDPLSGFSGVDLRTPEVPTSGIWLLQPAAGPIRVPRTAFSFCPLENAPPDLVLRQP